MNTSTFYSDAPAIAHTYTNDERPYDQVLIKADDSYSILGESTPADEELWDMAEGLQVVGWTLLP